jgi:hypothetical protein
MQNTVGDTESTATMCPSRETFARVNNDGQFTLLCYGQSSDDVDVPDRDLLDEMSVARKDLHAAALVATVANDELARLSDHGHFPRIPQLTLFFARDAELVLVLADLVEDLNPVIVRVGHDDLFVNAETEAVRRVELTFLWTERPELGAHLHRLAVASRQRALRDTVEVHLDRTIQRDTGEGCGRATVVAVARSAAVRARVRGQQRRRRIRVDI